MFQNISHQATLKKKLLLNNSRSQLHGKWSHLERWANILSILKSISSRAHLKSQSNKIRLCKSSTRTSILHLKRLSNSLSRNRNRQILRLWSILLNHLLTVTRKRAVSKKKSNKCRKRQPMKRWSQSRTKRKENIFPTRLQITLATIFLMKVRRANTLQLPSKRIKQVSNKMKKLAVNKKMKTVLSNKRNLRNNRLLLQEGFRYLRRRSHPHVSLSLLLLEHLL